MSQKKQPDLCDIFLDNDRWGEEYKDWNRRSLADRQYVYWWADGIYTSLREDDDERLCLLVIIGVTPEGKKERVGIRQ